MEELKAKLTLESNRREVFERKNAELERINDELRLENGNLLDEVGELRKKLAVYGSDPVDQSDSCSDDNDYEKVSDVPVITPNGSSSPSQNGFNEDVKTNSTGGSNLVTNSNHSNGNRAGEKDVKIMTLKRKQKMLKAELEQSLTQRVGFQEAFQEELDLRTKIEERLDNLRARYERLVVENDQLRTVLKNHCIDVPPHQPITRKRRTRIPSDHTHLKPPKFVPPGRRSSPSKGKLITSSSLDQSISSKSSTSLSTTEEKEEEAMKKRLERPSSEPPCFEEEPRSPQKTGTTASLDRDNEGLRKKSDNRLHSRGGSDSSEPQSSSAGQHDLSSSNGDSSPSDNEELCSLASMEHIFIEERSVTPTLTTPTVSFSQEMDSILNTTTDQIASAKAFYDLVRQRVRSQSESD